MVGEREIKRIESVEAAEELFGAGSTMARQAERIWPWRTKSDIGESDIGAIEIKPYRSQEGVD